MNHEWGNFCGVLLPYAQSARPLVKRGNSIRTAILRTIKWAIFSFRMGDWVVIQYLQKDTARLSWERRSSQASSQATPGMPKESGKETDSLQTLRNYTHLTRQKFTLKDSTQKKFSCRNKESSLHASAQMVRQSWLVKTTKFGHPSAHQGEGDNPPLQKSKKHG